MMHEHNVGKRANKYRVFFPNASLDHKWSQFSSLWLFHFSSYWPYWPRVLNSRLFQAVLAFQKSRMSSFSLELQVRASQELVAKQMPKRSILVRAMLFAETASALLLIEFGLFTHPAMIVLPLFIIQCCASFPREDCTQGKRCQGLELRSVFSSLLAPKHYSAFGLRRRQENIRSFVWPMMFVRLICAIVVTKSLSDGCLVGCPYYQCEIDVYYDKGQRQVDRWMRAGFGNESLTGSAKECFPEGASISEDAIEYICRSTEPNLQSMGRHTWPIFPNSMAPPGSRPVCSSIPIANMIFAACEIGDLDPVAYVSCFTTLQGDYFPGYCAQVFFFCSSIRGKNSGPGAVLVAAYMFVPICGFGLLILLHLLPAFSGQSGMMSVPEDKDLRQAIRARTRQLQQELRTGRPQSSLWWDRRAFEFKMSFLVIDVLLDAWSCFGFFRDGSWGFATCQLLLLLISFFVELRSIGFKQFFFAIAESWKAGLPSDLVCPADPVICLCLFSLNLRPPTASSRSPQPHSLLLENMLEVDTNDTNLTSNYIGCQKACQSECRIEYPHVDKMPLTAQKTMLEKMSGAFQTSCQKACNSLQCYGEDCSK